MSATPAENPFLRDNYAPWPHEVDVPVCEIEGELPNELEGTFYRNGPNPQFPPRSRYHWFDGDAMIHAFSFSNGQCRYRNRWLRTEKFLAEREAGEGLFGGLLDIQNNDPRARGVAMNPANTNLVSHAGRFLALYEAGPPTELDPRTLETRGVFTFDEKLVGPMTAHPHVDPETGEMFFFAYSPFPPHVRYHVVDASGALVQSEAIETPVATMMHDVIVTREHVVFLVCPATMRMENLTTGAPIRWEPELGTRLGVMPRRGASLDLRWFDLPAGYVFHVMDATTEGARIVADVCLSEELTLFDSPGRDVGLDEADMPFLTRWTLDLEGASAKQDRLDDRPCEFPRLDDRHAMSGNRFGIAAAYCEGDRALGLFDGVVRYDHARGTRTEVRFPGYLGEAVFVPRRPEAPEGEGFVLVNQWRPDTGRGELLILDAENLPSGPLATVKLPHRLPHGFHAAYLDGVTLAEV